MVDEYQDTNFSQYLIVKSLAAVNENICVVGDDAQSIYAFRGANIQNILNFEKDYPDLKVFKLEQNYRSTQNIVNVANSIIANNKEQLKKNVFSEKETGDKIKVMRAFSDNEEGKLVAEAIMQERTTNGLKWHDFAIFTVPTRNRALWRRLCARTASLIKYMEAYLSISVKRSKT
jgi:DNA helicase-2/ATP-dependent DNA helicase PcrA